MLKINFYHLFFFFLFFNSANVLCSSFNQNNSRNSNTVLGGLLLTNPSNSQQGVGLLGQFIFNGPNFINIDNSTSLFLLPVNVSANGGNNIGLPLTLFNVVSAFSNSVIPAPQSENAGNVMTSSSTSNNFISSVLSHTDQNGDQVLTEKIKKKKCPKKTYTCPTCHKNLANHSSFNYHLKTHNPNREKPFKCHICNRGFTAKSSLKYHTFIHSGEKPFQCHICQKGLSSKTALKDHLNKHQGRKPYKCTLCSKAYHTKSGFQYHIKVHKAHKKYLCHYCNASFLYEGEFDLHIRYEEETNEDRKCHICKTGYTSSLGLKHHNKRAHSKT